MLPERAPARMMSEAMSGTSIVVPRARAVGPSSTPSLVGKTARHVNLPCSLPFAHTTDHAASGQRFVIHTLLAGRRRRARVLQVPRGKLGGLSFSSHTVEILLLDRDAQRSLDGNRRTESGDAYDPKLKGPAESPPRVRRIRVRKSRWLPLAKLHPSHRHPLYL